MNPPWKRLLVGTLAAGMLGLAPTGAAAAPAITLTAPATLTAAVRIAFSTAVKNVTTANVVLRVASPSSGVATKLGCRGSDGSTVSCSTGPVRAVLLTPKAPLVTAQRYTAVVSPDGVAPVTTTAGDPVAKAARSFTTSATAQENSPGATYRWSRRTSTGTVSGGFWVERTAGAQAVFSFSGTSITWYTVAGPAFGKARVSVDGTLVRTVNNYAATTKKKVGRTISGLSPGSHRLKIRVTGAKGSPDATDARVAIDAFKVAGTMVTSPPLRFAWAPKSVAGASGGRYVVSSMPGARVLFAFKGKGIDWVTIKGPSAGKADVFVDGSRRRTIDLYAASTGFGVRAGIAGLTDRVHTLTVVVRSDKNKASSSRMIAIDVFVVRRPSTAAFRGLGAWVDLWDYGLNPETASADMAQRGVRTLYLQTARWNSSADILYPELVERWVHAAHANKMRIVGWYLPAYSQWLDRDIRRTLAVARYRTSKGQRFDALGVDIEYKGETDSSEEFNEGITRHLRRVRAGVGNAYPVGGIVPAPRGMALSPSSWTGFPWGSVGRYSDVVMPMGYWSYRTDCPTNPDHCAYNYTRNNVADARAFTKLPVHEIGGVGDAVTASEVGDFGKAVRDARAIGGSLYDYVTTKASFWSGLTTING